MRARELGLRIGLLEPGEHDAITDVAGVQVGHTTLISGEGPLVIGQGPVRTGVTVILPHSDDVWTEPVFAGCHRLNGNGELTGLEWVREAGQLGGVIAITNTHSVGVVRDALVAHGVPHRRRGGGLWSLPVVGETWDGTLNDVDGLHVRPAHVDAAIAAAAGGPVAQGNVGGGTGMVCHEFKGGIGTASRVVEIFGASYTLGALVQANYGLRDELVIAGVPVGRELPDHRVYSEPEPASGGDGSIIVVLATDAPLLPHQLERVARRAALGLARNGAIAHNGSGDIFIAFSTADQSLGRADRVLSHQSIPNDEIDSLFAATVQATEEAIVNALVAARDMTGDQGRYAKALPHAKLQELLTAAGRTAP
jgi:D-aminopeptidase